MTDAPHFFFFRLSSILFAFASIFAAVALLIRPDLTA